MTAYIPDELVLAIYATSRGFAFVLLEGPESPFDWGVREIDNPSRNQKCLGAIAELIDRNQPAHIVLEDTADPLSRRNLRVQHLYRSVEALANRNFVDVHRVSKQAIRDCFAGVGAVTKHEIAQAIALRIPAFAIRIPPVRKPWMSQDSRQSLFDAVALGLAYFKSESSEWRVT
ncbi:MAG: hypothetical protein AB7P08_06250 [Burkholderiales bacterium]